MRKKRRKSKKAKSCLLVSSGLLGMCLFVGFVEAWMLVPAFISLGWVLFLTYANIKKPCGGRRKAKKKVEKVKFVHYFHPDYIPKFDVTQLR